MQKNQKKGKQLQNMEQCVHSYNASSGATAGDGLLVGEERVPS